MNPSNYPQLQNAVKQLKDELERVRRHIEQVKMTHPKIVYIETPCPEIDALRWLSEIDAEEKMYWGPRHLEEEVAAIGTCINLQPEPAKDAIAALFSQIDSHLGELPNDVRFYGGLSFDPESSAEKEWQPFHPARFILPAVEYRKTKKETWIRCYMYLSPTESACTQLDKITNLIGSFRTLNFSEATHACHWLNRKDEPDHQQWQKTVETACRDIQSGSLEKVVISRKTHITLDQEFSPFIVLSKLKENTSNVFRFGFQFGKDQVFFGRSPELLLARQQDDIQSEALAGTETRGSTEKSDGQLAATLFADPKKNLEHTYVRAHILKQLSPYCCSLHATEQNTVVKLPGVQHLSCTIEGKLKPHISHATLLNTLHPTPAICGVPENSAREWIKNHETHTRGWYAGPVGWLSKQDCQFAVAIRSGLLKKKDLYIYTGAGIVAGSDPDSEWDELNAKLENFSHAFKESCLN